MLAVFATATSADATAQISGGSFAAVCSGLTGYTYSLRDAEPGASKRIEPDAITNGRIMILIGRENGPGGAEVKFRDASGAFISATADGAAVQFLGFNDENRIARVETHYRTTGVTENYLLKFEVGGAVSLAMTTVRSSGFVPKVSVLVGHCEAY